MLKYLSVLFAVFLMLAPASVMASYDPAQLKSSALSGDAEAQEKIAELYLRGKGIRKSPPHAYLWYQIASLNGSEAATDARLSLRKEIGVPDRNWADTWAFKCINSKYRNCPGIDFAETAVAANPTVPTSVTALEVLESKRITEGSSDLYMLVERIYDPERDCTYVRLTGAVPRNSTPATSMIRNLDECNGHKTVYLHNDGGYLEGALRLAEFFKRNNVHTVVGKNNSCFSACTLIFMGGRERTLQPGSQLVFHAPYESISKNDSKPHCSTRTVKWWKHQIREMLGYSKNSNEIGKRAFSHCGFDGGWTPTMSEARELGIITQ